MRRPRGARTVRRLLGFARLPRFRSRGVDAGNAAIWAAIWAFLLLPASVDFLNGYATDGYGCRVVGVVDGDTVGLHCPGEIRIVSGRVLGYDTPEIFSPKCLSETIRGVVAKWELRLALWRADTIGASRSGTDRYGRELVRLTLDGQDIALRMVAAGLGRTYGGDRRHGWCS